MTVVREHHRAAQMAVDQAAFFRIAGEEHEFLAVAAPIHRQHRGARRADVSRVRAGTAGDSIHARDDGKAPSGLIIMAKPRLMGCVKYTRVLEWSKLVRRVKVCS